MTKANNFTILAKANENGNNLQEFLSYKNDVQYIDKTIPAFYIQILKYWYEIYSTEPTTNTEVREEQLWNNKNILIDNKPALFTKWKNKGINKINDLISNDGDFKNIQQINDQYGSRFNVLDFYSIKSAIPQRWKQMITNDNIIIGTNAELTVKINNINKPVYVLSNKEIYWELIDKQRERPTAIEKWE